LATGRGPSRFPRDSQCARLLDRMHALLVSDDRQRCQQVVACLARLGHDATLASDPAGALALLHPGSRFDFVIVDWDSFGGGAPALPPEALRTARLGFLAITDRPTDHAQVLLSTGTPYLVPSEPAAVIDLRLGTMLSWRQRRGRDLVE